MDSFNNNTININPTYFMIGESIVLVEDLTQSQIDFLLQKCDRKKVAKQKLIEEHDVVIKKLKYQIAIQDFLKDFLSKRKLIFVAAGVTKLEKKTPKKTTKKDANAISAVVSTTE